MKRWWAGLALIVVLLGGLVWWATRPSEKCGGNSSSSVSSVTAPSPADAGASAAADPSAAAGASAVSAEEYWTPERMASARPAEMPQQSDRRRC